ncbi:tRNA (adenosine(37)-N6)-threonylcarbamoyltransferase complex ATPase subunit type 1 TsaE [Dongia rigui]|uniref:tRNA threonylcarbamoyladenosine biosynthesis protein TsaE n=1 Tax=Dongia rigui TaxID=940149 RepID=A0ABU5DU41_9PROT|nr:tRNA (adenosine(37)-N6)-threonylcarbamoyltransferase complex ATPase subunit type 1 TsaE [Dongia rigui]MDY0870836.1 tRNA (adenosine(37)-N6)-threonylcarbamoyltransferase complex ATPase subunit type 1 TsaE [Dongia rigui]
MTARAGRILAGLARAGDVLALWGDLGAGKTTLARGFIAAVVPAEEVVPSPTFTLVQTYAADIGGSPADIWHFDLYRLKSAEEAYEVGIEEAFAEGISLIEWPERLGSLLPRHRLDVTLLPGVGADSRILSLAGPDAWMQRLGGFKSALSGE